MDHQQKDIPNKLKSAIEGRCPRCRTGKMFEGPTYRIFSNKMRVNCPHCGLKFEKEPGYFYVAMYLSYVFVVAELVTVSVATYVLTGVDDSPWLYLIVACIAIALLAPFNGRYARVVLLYWMTPQFEFKESYFDGRTKE